jgi:opacity protein-like surface antigen
MKKFLIAALALSAASAYADTSSMRGFYLGGGASSTKNDWDSTTFNPVEIFGGYKLNPYVGGEIRAGASSGGDAKITNFESIYYRTESANSVGKTYLLLGYTHADIEAENGNYNFNGFSYGAGVGFIVNDYFNLNLEYKILLDGDGTHYIDKINEEDTEIKLSSVSVTVDYRF